MTVQAKSRLFFSFIIVLLLLSGCFQQKTPVEKIYQVLEKVVSSEKGFEEQQKPLVALERKEKGIYDQIIGLGMKRYDKIVTLSNQAISVVEKRKEYMEVETKSIQESEKEFKKMEKLKNEIDKKKLKNQADDLYRIMMKRYKAHEVLYKEYNNGIKYDKQLYEMFKDKSLSMDKLESQVNKLNDIYKKIYQANDDFNHLTMQYNAKKLAFYKEAGLKFKE